MSNPSSISAQKQPKVADGKLQPAPSAGRGGKNAATNDPGRAPKGGGLLSRLRGSRELGLLFLAPEDASLEEVLELLRFAAALQGRTEHQRIALVPASLESLFHQGGGFAHVHSFGIGEKLGPIIKRMRSRIDLAFAPRTMGIRMIHVHTLHGHVSHYHRHPSLWSALSGGVLEKMPMARRLRKRSLERDLENAGLHLAHHALRLRASMHRIFDATEAQASPVWLPVSLDPFTGSPWPFSNYMRLARLLAQNGVPFVVSVDEHSARRLSKKDQEVLSGLPAFRRELALLARKHGGVEVMDSPSVTELFALAKGARLTIGAPSAELLLAQTAGGRLIHLHDMLTYRSSTAKRPEDVAVHPSHGRVLFADAVEVDAGPGLAPHVDECARDCPACDHNFCIDTISPEKVWEEARTLLDEVRSESGN